MKAITVEPLKFKGKRVAPGAVITLDAKQGKELVATGAVVEATPEALAALEQLQQLDAGNGAAGEGGSGGDGGEDGAGGTDTGTAGGTDTGAAGTQGAAQ